MAHQIDYSFKKSEILDLDDIRRIEGLEDPKTGHWWEHLGNWKSDKVVITKNTTISILIKHPKDIGPKEPKPLPTSEPYQYQSERCWQIIGIIDGYDRIHHRKLYRSNETT
jgi:hypothetical protein